MLQCCDMTKHHPERSERNFMETHFTNKDSSKPVHRSLEGGLDDIDLLNIGRNSAVETETPLKTVGM